MPTPDESLRPFRIETPESDLDDLRSRLDRTRWPDELPGVGWSYGVPRDYLQDLAGYWRHEYDWRAAEARLNRWPQYLTTIDGTTVHFAHLRSPEPDATPLIITHGWPGSIAEFEHIAGPLTDPRAYGADPADAFHLVLPSIPGFGFSGPTREPGWDHLRVARAFAELMRRLGYERYGAQGGDWGSAISRELGRLFPEQVFGVHLNLIPGAAASAEPTPEELAALSPAEQARTIASWERTEAWLREKQGYADLQSTRPQTLSYALTDSPVGQLAWIAEKFREWTDSRGRGEDAVEGTVRLTTGDAIGRDITTTTGGVVDHGIATGDVIDRDHLLTNVMLYWLTGTAGSSARIYYERAHAPYWGSPPEPSRTPTGLACFPAENFIVLRHRAERSEHLVRWTEFDRGGHFAAMEVPDLLVGDIRGFFRQLREA